MIGRPPEDPILQIDNIQLATRHVNAMLIQRYFTIEQRPPPEAQNVFESLGFPLKNFST